MNLKNIQYKILTLLITLLTGLIFSSSVSAGWGGDEYEFRCTIDYKQLSLVSARETNQNHTSNFEADSCIEACERAGEKILDKIYVWLDFNETRIIVDVTSNMKCKKRSGYFWWKKFSDYSHCNTYVADMMVGDIVKKFPYQIDHIIALRDYIAKTEQNP
jgi:hypothetical protein